MRFARLLGQEPGIAVIHSSIADLAPPRGFREVGRPLWFGSVDRCGLDDCVASLHPQFLRGPTVPSFSEPVRAGLLADWFLDTRADARRTPHPIYSFAVAGPVASKIAACPSTTTFGDDSRSGCLRSRMRRWSCWDADGSTARFIIGLRKRPWFLIAASKNRWQSRPGRRRGRARGPSDDVRP